MNKWFRLAKKILGNALAFAHFSLKAAIFRAMPRSQPGAMMRNVEKNLIVLCFCLSPFFITAAIIYAIAASVLALGSVVIGCVAAIFNHSAVEPAIQHSAPITPPASGMSQSHVIITSKLNENKQPAAQASPIIIPDHEISFDEVLDVSHEESAFCSPSSSEDISLSCIFF